MAQRASGIVHRRGRLLGDAAAVTASQLSLAAGSYLVLALSGRPLDPAGFAALSSFYLLVNTVGRGLCSAVELNLTRAAAAEPGSRQVLRTGRRQAACLLALALVLVAVSAPLLHDVLGGSWTLVLLLGATMPGMAWAYLQRGALAGARTYGRYSTGFATEAVVTVGLGAVLAVTGNDQVALWALSFTLGPTAAALVVAALTRWAAPAPAATGTTGSPAPPSTAPAALVWSVLVLGGSQAVWNLPPVILAARLGDAPEVAAGFAALAIVLRVPVLLFPAVQAVLLPRLAGAQARPGTRPATARRSWWWVVAAAAVVFLLLGTVVAPPLVELVFGQSPGLPPHVPLLLAAATLAGGAAQVGQTYLVAAGDFRTPGAVWVAGLAAVVLLGTLGPASPTTGAVSLAAATVVVALALGRSARARGTRTPDPRSTTT